ncbi:hypothetical protein EOL96_00330 [Candidatus Saccharibacteria bacterium]|nr:hypothetical protein [Candidatus Saccharibacteria bacterium]
MTSETLSHPDDNTDNKFRNLISQNWAESPSVDRYIDSGVRRLLNAARELEEALNRTENVSDELIAELLQDINADWDQLSYNGRTIRISGKLRPTRLAIDNNIEELIGEDDFAALDERKEDTRGDYYLASGMPLQVDGFSLEKVPIGNEQNIYQVTLGFMLDEDYPDDVAWFTAYPDEITLIEVPEPSDESIEDFVSTHFPDVYRRINVLPDDCQDAELIRQVLDEFTLTTDLSRSGLTMGVDEILDVIETYMTNRLKFDSGTYCASINGLVHGHTETNIAETSNFHGKLDQLIVGAVRLWPMTAELDNTAATVYRPVIETWYPAPGWNNGRVLVYIPIDSLTKLESNRPELRSFPFDIMSLVQLPNEPFEQEFPKVPLHISGAGSQATATETNSQDFDVSELPTDRLKMLLLYQEDLEYFQEAVRNFITGENSLFSTEAQAKNALSNVNNEASRFFSRWKYAGGGIDVIALGEGVRMLVAKTEREFDFEQGTLEYRLKDVSLAGGDIVTQKKGIISEFRTQIQAVEIDDTVKYVLHAAIFFHDDEGFRPAALAGPMYGTPLIALGGNKKFYVNIADGASFSVPELDDARRYQESLDAIDKLPINPATRRTIKHQIDSLSTELNEASPDEIVEYFAIEGLRDIAYATAGNEQASQVAAYAIQAALTPGRTIGLVGPMYDKGGALEADYGIIAKLDAVISTHPHLPSPEIAFLVTLVDADDDEDNSEQYVVPLSTLEALQY